MRDDVLFLIGLVGFVVGWILAMRGWRWLERKWQDAQTNRDHR